MGMSIDDAKRASMWEMAAATERWMEAHDPEGHNDKPGSRLSEDDKDEIWAWMQEEGYVKPNGAGPRYT
jgi:hypothetical protein